MKTDELLKLAAAATIGDTFLPYLQNHIQGLCSQTLESCSLDVLIFRHAPRDIEKNNHSISGSCIRIFPDGKSSLSKKKFLHLFSPYYSSRHVKLGTGIRKHFMAAYGASFKYHSNTDCFDFSNSDLRIRRILSLFTHDFQLTDPVEFLNRLHYRVVKNRKPAVIILSQLSRLFKKHFSIDTDKWLENKIDFQAHFNELEDFQKNLIVPILDGARHLIDATPHELYPLEREGIMIFANPQKYCPDDFFPTWIKVLDELFPNMQFILESPGDLDGKLSNYIFVSKFKITLPRLSPKKTEGNSYNVFSAPDTALLIDIDSKMPNVALMKLSTYLKKQGKKIILSKADLDPLSRTDLELTNSVCSSTPLSHNKKWNIRKVEEVYGSSVFYCESSMRRVEKLKKLFGEKLIVGGSGINLKLRLPEEIENLQADYELYPELGDRALGFLTRGCPFHCKFCVVPEKEGNPRQVSTLDDLLQNRKKLVLLDDNILSVYHAEKLLEELALKGIQVNFNQTLDINLVDKYRAKLIKRIKCSNYKFTRINYYFSLNGINNLEKVRRNYDFFDFRHKKDNIQFLCMYAYDTTLEQDVERFRFLRSLPGAYVFVQKYKAIPGGRTPPNLENFFNDIADDLIDQLIKIIFPQNMKSMEQYYKWLSNFYFEVFGKLHTNLVDTIFKYNLRDKKSQYIEKYASLKTLT